MRKLELGTTFSDFEGKLIYCLIRDRKSKKIIYEISQIVDFQSCLLLRCF